MSSLADSKVLIVDDVAANRRILSMVLKEYQTIEAEDGYEALRIVAESVPDIILLDIQMPGIDGFEICKRLKASPDTADVPIIFITGTDTPGLAGKCLKIGAVDFITKPFDLEEVKARIGTHLTLRKTGSALLKQNRLLEETIKEQRLNSKLARQVLEIIDFPPLRNIKLLDRTYMFVNVMARACNDEGGDHFLIKTMPVQKGGKKTMVSLKDQSGHSVNCILRSIITDLLHNSILYNNPNETLQKNVTLLNNAIYSTGLFEGDDFFTAFFLEIDHESKMLDYISAGHPSLFLIRKGIVKRLPERGGDEGVNLPLAFQENIHFQPGHVQLLEGDRILLYTDGLTELPMGGAGKALQSQDLKEIVQEMVDSDQKITVSALMNNLPAAILQKGGDTDGDVFSRQLHDDVTIVGLEISTIAGFDWQTFVPAEQGGIDGLIKAVFSYASGLAANVGVELDDYKLRMVLTEGILNAWKHGNSSANDKPIVVGWSLGNDLSLLIKDQGHGFDYLKLKNPARLGNREHESGRGIFCMKKYADFVGWQDNGSTLVLSFRTKSHSWEQVGRPFGARVDLWRDPLPGL